MKTQTAVVVGVLGLAVLGVGSYFGYTLYQDYKKKKQAEAAASTVKSITDTVRDVATAAGITIPKGDVMYGADVQVL